MRMWLHEGHRNEDGTKQRKHIGLDEADQRVEQQHEQRESHRDQRRPGTHAHAKLARENEDERHQHDDHHVAAHHVGKKSDHQRHGLGEDAQ